MYKEFFGLHQRPFSVTPDPTFFYPSASHRDGLANLRYGIRERMGFVVLTGEVGLGKTFLIRSLLRELGEDVKRALILNPVLDPDELFDAILRDLEVPFNEEDGFGKKLETFNEYLLDQYQNGALVVVIIDESQNLPAESLERLRLLSNLETATSKLLQIVLVGQPELNDVLAMPGIRQLNQRITVRHELTPLTAKETPEYIEHRLKVAGGNAPQVRFDPNAARLVHKASGGIPRVIGILCDYALLIAFTEEKKVVTPSMVREAVRKHQQKKHRSRVFRWNMPRGWKLWVPAALGVFLLILTMGLTAFNLFWRPTEQVGFWSDRSQGNEPVLNILPVTRWLRPAQSKAISGDFSSPSTVKQSRPGLSLGFGEDPHDGGTRNAALEAVMKVPVEEPDNTLPASSPEPEAEETLKPGFSDLSGTPAREVVDKEPTGVGSAEAVSVSGEMAVPSKSSQGVGSSAEKPRSAGSEANSERFPVNSETPDSPIDPNLRYGVQVASFRSLEKAQKMAEEIKDYGPVFLVPWTSPENQEEWVRVILGVYNTRSEGRDLIRRIADKRWGRDAWVVENRWWRQKPAKTGGDVFTMADE